MDALRRAEAEKKQAAKNKHADQAESVASNSNASIETDSQSVEHDDEDLGATVKLDRLPLPISKKQSESASSIEVEDVAATASLDDLNVDFDSTSPRVRVTESTLSESANDERAGFDAFARPRRRRRVWDFERRVWGEAGRALVETVPSFDEKHFVSRHARRVEPALIWVECEMVDFADPVRKDVFGRNEVVGKDARGVGKG